MSLLLALACMGLLVSCGGGGGGSASNRNLPPDPGAAATSTLTGVDTNNNGVRDEVEIDISQNTPKNEDFGKTIAVAKAYQEILNGPAPTTRDDALKIEAKIICAASGSGTSYGGSDENYLLQKTFDTPSRKQKYDQVTLILGGGFDAAEALELAPCAN